MASEKPILFSGPMIRAILDGRKTMTRRVVKPQHLPWIEGIVGHYAAGEWSNRPFPYGKPGDRLWVRETFAFSEYCSTFKEPCKEALGAGWGVIYRADNLPDEDIAILVDKWKPSIHMPRWASRITLEITGVRVERLQDITEEDAKAEGVQMPDGIPKPPDWWSYQQEFEYLWNEINGAESWAANPFVWVVEFKKI